MRVPNPDELRPDDAVLVISVAAELSGLHAQTLRTYDRLGLVIPERTSGGGRRYTLRDVALLREVQRLSQEEGITLAGIKLIIELRRQLSDAQAALSEAREELGRMYEAARRVDRATRGGPRGELVHVPRSTQVVLWRPRNERDSDGDRSRGNGRRTGREG